MSDRSTFTVKVTMEDRWIPEFFGLLREMERLGHVGSSRHLCFYADGDGDFRPDFQTDVAVEPAESTITALAVPVQLWDAG